MLPSNTLRKVGPSPTMAISDLAGRLKAGGRDIIALSAGEPDFGTPEHIRAAGIRAIEEGRARYTPVDGIPELKEAICAKFERDNHLTHGPSEISVGSGGKQVLFNALMATLNPGDEVIIPAPYWVSYPDMVKIAGGEPVVVATRSENGYRMTAEELEAAITRTRWLIFEFAFDPTGAGYGLGDLKALTEVLTRHRHVWTMSDDMYEHLTFDGFTFHTPAEVEPELRGRTLTVNGVSKAYAMTGWRIGYAGGPKDLVAQMRKMQSQSTSNPCSISQWAAVAALNGPQDFLAERAKAFQRRRDLVTAALNACPGISCPIPDGAFYVYPDISELIGGVSRSGHRIHSDEDFATALLDEEGVAVVFGAAFGLSPAFRVSYAASDDMLRDACSRILRFTEGIARGS